MRKTSLFALAVCFMVAGALMNGQRPSSRNSDEAAIRKAWQDYLTAWNKHDSKLLATFLAEDVDRRTANGQILNGRTETLAGIEREWGPNKDSTAKSIQVDVRFLTADVAILDARDEMRIAGVPVRTNHTSIFVRENGRWLTAAIRACQLTTPAAQ